jgi:hypothetical protein
MRELTEHPLVERRQLPLQQMLPQQEQVQGPGVLFPEQVEQLQLLQAAPPISPEYQEVLIH